MNARALSRSERSAYDEQGYLVLPGLIAPAEVSGAIAAIGEILESRAPEIRRRHSISTTADGRRYWNYYDNPANDRAGRSAAADALVFAPGLRVQGEAVHGPGEPPPPGQPLNVRKLEYFTFTHPVFFSLVIGHPGLTGVLRSVLDDEPVSYAATAMLKPINGGAPKPWHQDAAYFNVDPLGGTAGLWVALEEATAANGCMHVAPGWHRRDAWPHVHRFDCEIDDPSEFSGDAVAVEMQAGDVLLFSPMLPHFTPPNDSPRRRWALQLHYRGATSRLVDKQTYDRIFVTAAGRPASCFQAQGGERAGTLREEQT